jgi:squalene-associated FAD-dependent desaturase
MNHSAVESADAPSSAGAPPSVAICGGGLAGMAAAVALTSAGCRVTLFEARRYLGGRASSFRDANSGQWVDLCQHVSMGCCTNLTDFCRRTGIAQLFRRERVLHFFAPNGRRFDLAAARGWPAPLHLAPALWRMKYLSAKERIGIGRALLRLARMPAAGVHAEPTVGEWLARDGQSPAAIERFWSVVLLSALGESLDRAGLSAARKVFVDGFMASREAYVVEVPNVPLTEIYDVALRRWFKDQGVELRAETAIRQVEAAGEGRFEIALPGGGTHVAEAVVIAVPWRQVAALVGPTLAPRLPWLDGAATLDASPISGVHLWFDRPITELAHVVLVGRTSQWVFHRPRLPANEGQPGYYYQVVISAARELGEVGQQETVRTVLGDLCAVFPAACEAQLLSARVITDPQAVFSVGPGSERLRPAQRTAVRGFAVAGDWTATGWPATMEGAVRSGYLAAEAVLTDFGRPASFLCADLPRGWLARLLLA